MYFFHFQLLKNYKGFEKWYNNHAERTSKCDGYEY